jgi:N-acetylneuraminate synthase
MNKTYIIAEVGINHNGDLELAKQLIDKAKQSGCDAVKFQKRTVDVVYSSEELDTPRKSPFGTTTREQKYGIELELGEYKELESYTKDKGMDFIVSCWDL